MFMKSAYGSYVWKKQQSPNLSVGDGRADI